MRSEKTLLREENYMYIEGMRKIALVCALVTYSKNTKNGVRVPLKSPGRKHQKVHRAQLFFQNARLGKSIN